MIETCLHPGHTFDQFACGNCNQLAFSLAEQVAKGSLAANPLFIYGAIGLGKSHLLNAIGHQALSSNQSTRIIYCSTEKFRHTFINCLKANQVHEFQEYFGSADLLMMDDIQFFSCKERSQQEFLCLYDRISNRQARIVLTCNTSPSKLEFFSDELLSRFSGGLVVELSAPDYEAKRVIIEKLAVRHQIKLLEDVADYMANIQVRSIRELEGGLIRLGAYSSMQNVEISLSLAMKYLQDMTSNVSHRNEKMEATVLWKKCTMDTFYYDGEADTDSDCEVRIDGNEIVISYDGGEGPVVYKGQAKGTGHYELRSVGVEGRATLHMFEGGKFLEGFWIEDGTEGMWRITLE